MDKSTAECPKPLSVACIEGLCTHQPLRPFPDGYLPGTKIPRFTPANIKYVTRANARQRGA